MRESADAWYIHTPEQLLPAGTKCAACSHTEFRKEMDILDVWFESGASSHAVLDFDKDTQRELFARAILSWIPNKSGGLASLDQFVFTVTEPVLAPVRRVIPPVGGFDISFLVVIFAIMIVRTMLRV